MSNYDTLKHEYARAAPEDRLRVLRAELQRPLLEIQGVAALLKQAEADGLGNLPRHVLPDEFDHLVEWLRQASADIHDIVEALTGEVEHGSKRG